MQQLIKIYKGNLDKVKQHIERLINTQLVQHWYHDVNTERFTTHCDSDLLGEIWIEFQRIGPRMCCDIYPVKHRQGYRSVYTTNTDLLFHRMFDIDYYSIGPGEVTEMLQTALFEWYRKKIRMSRRIQTERKINREYKS